MRITLLNTSVLTTFGTFNYEPISLDEVKSIATMADVQSAIGHKDTALLLTRLLGVDIPENRIQYSQAIGETAFVFKLKSRPPEGVILDEAGIEKIGYEFGILKRLK